MKVLICLRRCPILTSVRTNEFKSLQDWYWFNWFNWFALLWGWDMFLALKPQPYCTMTTGRSFQLKTIKLLYTIYKTITQIHFQCCLLHGPQDGTPLLFWTFASQNCIFCEWYNQIFARNWEKISRVTGKVTSIVQKHKKSTGII